MQSMGLEKVRHNLATEQQIEINFTKWTSGFKGFLDKNCAGTCAHTGTHVYTHVRQRTKNAAQMNKKIAELIQSSP